MYTVKVYIIVFIYRIINELYKSINAVASKEWTKLGIKADICLFLSIFILSVIVKVIELSINVKGSILIERLAKYF